MTSSRRWTPGARPVIIEVVPTDGNKRRSISPNSTASAKGVQFAATTEISRPLTDIEAWSLWHFEYHASRCPHCRDPYLVYKRRGRLCDIGRGLAHDVTLHVYYLDDQIYSQRPEGSKPVRVEMSHKYDHTRALLRAVRKGFRVQSSAAIMNTDRTYPALRPRVYHDDAAADDGYDRRHETVIIEPAHSSSSRRKHDHHHHHHHQTHSHSKHQSTRYPKIIIDEDNVADSSGWTPSQLRRRGTVYEEDMLRKRDKYRVEYREPLSFDHRDKRMSFYL